MGIWQDLDGTSLNKFAISLAGPLLKFISGGRIEVRDTTDTSFAAIATSRVDVTGDLIKLGSEGANVLNLQRNASQAAPITWTFPPNVGTAGQVWGTDGVGGISLITLAGGADKVGTDTTTLSFGDTSPKNMFTLPANAVINEIRITIDTPFNGSPTMSVGIAGTTSKYFPSLRVDLKRIANTLFQVSPGIASVGTTEALIITYAAGGATAGSARIEVFYGVPN